MGRQHRQRTVVTREEALAQLKARGLSDADIAHELATEAYAHTTVVAHEAAVGPKPEPKPKDRYRIRNWAAYNQALINRGSLTFWFDEACIAGWCANMHPEASGRPTIYSDIAITCARTVKEVFQLALRQTQGFVASLLTLMQLELPTPSYSTLSRRSATLDVGLDARRRQEPLHVVVDCTGLKVFGEGEWKVRQHGWQKRRTWRKLHVGVDEATGESVAQLTTEREVSDDRVLEELLAQVEDPIAHVSADGAYDTWECHRVITARQARPTIPPDSTAVDHGTDRFRDQDVRRIAEIGRAAWKRECGYHRRSLSETAMFRLKTIFGRQFAAHQMRRQQTEGAIRCRALNRMTRLGMPDSYRVASIGVNLVLQRELAEGVSDRSGAHRRRNQGCRWANRFVHIAYPTERAAAMGKRGRQVASVIVGNRGQHGVNRLRRRRQQHAEQGTDLREAQRWDFF
jgi:hypothetical protein